MYHKTHDLLIHKGEGSSVAAGPGVSANSALETAVGLASKATPLVVLPEWVRMPSATAQHWVRISICTALSGWAAIFLYRYPMPPSS